jgi:hypothetical protein
MISESQEVATMPEDFHKIVNDFVHDIRNTFPEYNVFIDKWWKEGMDSTSSEYIFNYCLKKYPPRFFDILYQNNDIFKEDSTTDTEFLPFIHFKNLWSCNISEKTRDTIWKYLQLLLFSIVGSLKNKELFGDTASMFDNINQDEFKTKLEETITQMQVLFDSNKNADTSLADTPHEIDVNHIPKASKLQEHISGMVGIIDGKLGTIAKEIAEETISDMNMNLDDVKDVKDVFEKLFKNPSKLMNMVKSVSNKLDNKVKSGEINEEDLLLEAGDIMKQMKNMPGIENIQSLLTQFGVGDLNNIAKSFMNTNANENTDLVPQPKPNARSKKRPAMVSKQPPKPQYNSPLLTDEELMELFKK